MPPPFILFVLAGWSKRCGNGVHYSRLVIHTPFTDGFFRPDFTSLTFPCNNLVAPRAVRSRVEDRRIRKIFGVKKDLESETRILPIDNLWSAESAPADVYGLVFDIRKEWKTVKTNGSLPPSVIIATSVHSQPEILPSDTRCRTIFISGIVAR